MGKLDGKVAVVTGASRGIGQAIAELFAAEGAKVVCAARTLNEGDQDHEFKGSLAGTVQRIERAGGEATAVPTDLQSEDDCLSLIEQANATYGPVDVLVNNAASTLDAQIAVKDEPVSRWKRVFDVNVHAPFILSAAVIPSMIERGGGAIVSVSSGAAVGPGRGPYGAMPGDKGLVPYGTTKAALERFTQGLAQEVYQYGISVTCFAPSEIVPTAATVFHEFSTGFDDTSGEPTSIMARAALLLATEPIEKVAGRVTYSQQILKEFGWIDEAKGFGIDMPGSGYTLT